MSEVNARWERDHWQIRKVAIYLAGIAAPLWWISYLMTAPIYTMPQWQWFAAVSVGTLVAAAACTIGGLVAIGALLTHDKPLPGSNY